MKLNFEITTAVIFAGLAAGMMWHVPAQAQKPAAKQAHWLRVNPSIYWSAPRSPSEPDHQCPGSRPSACILRPMVTRRFALPRTPSLPLFSAIGRQELNTDEAFRTRDARVRNVTEVDRIGSDFTRARPTDEVVATLSRAGVPAAEVRNPAVTVRDARVVVRGETVRLQHAVAPEADVYRPGVPIVFPSSTVGFDQPPPGIGEHNEAVYGGMLGYTRDELHALQSAGVI